MIYVHAGCGKCASTTIQRFLWGNARFLREQGRIYPDLETPEYRRSHHALPLELKRGKHAAWQRLRAVMDRCTPGQHIILSSENFSGSGPDALRTALGNEDIKIIFYLRDLAKLMVSGYAQATKVGGNTLDFDTFFERKFDTPSLNFPHRFAKWADVFGAANIAVRVIDPAVLVMGDVRTDILDAVGLTAAQIEAGPLEKSPDRNVSPGWKTLETLRDLIRVGVDRGAANDDDEGDDNADRAAVGPLSATFWSLVKGVEAPPGFAERGRYLTQEQFERCAERFDSYVGALKTMGMDTRLARTSRADFVARSFLPSIEHVPAAEGAAYLRQLSSLLLFALTTDDPKRSRPARAARDTPATLDGRTART